MDSIYGSVYPAELLLGQFYTARQYDDEDVATRACRSEEIFSKAKDRKNINPTDSNSMLTSKFFDRLRPVLKNIVGYKKDTITKFDTLVLAVREIKSQHDLKPVPKKKSTKQSTTTIENKQIQQLTAQVKKFSQEVRALKGDRDQ